MHSVVCIPLLPSAHAEDVGFRPTSAISRLFHAARSLAVYTSRDGSPRPAQHSLPAGHHPLLDRILTCRLSLKGFRLRTHRIVFPLSEVSWRTTAARCRTPVGGRPESQSPALEASSPSRFPLRLLRRSSIEKRTHRRIESLRPLQRCEMTHTGQQDELRAGNAPREILGVLALDEFIV